MSNYDTIQERIQNGEFEPTRPYPNAETLATDEAYQKMVKEIYRLAGEIAVLEGGKKAIQSDMQVAYDNERSDIRANFRSVLEKTYELQNHPKKDQIWRKAWEDGHSGGYFEILGAYDELAELVT